MLSVGGRHESMPLKHGRIPMTIATSSALDRKSYKIGGRWVGKVNRKKRG